MFSRSGRRSALHAFVALAMFSAQIENGWASSAAGGVVVTSALSAAREAYSAPNNELFTAQPTVERDVRYSATPDAFDLLLGPVVEADLNNAKAPIRLKAELFALMRVAGPHGIERFLGELDDFASQTLKVPNVHLDTGYEKLIEYSYLFWMYSTARPRMQPKSRWIPDVDYMLKRLLFQIGQSIHGLPTGAGMTWQQQALARLNVLEAILALSPALRFHPEFYGRPRVTESDDLGRFNYKERLEIVTKQYVSNEHDTASGALYVGGALLGLAALPLFGPLAMFGIWASAFGLDAATMLPAAHRGEDQRRQDLEALKQTEEAVISLIRQGELRNQQRCETLIAEKSEALLSK